MEIILKFAIKTLNTSESTVRGDCTAMFLVVALQLTS